MKRKGLFALWVGWSLSFLLALACIGILVQGILRDARWGQPAIPVDFSRPTGWQSETFRVWGEDAYVLFFSSVNHDPELSGRFLAADFQVRILGADGDPVLDRLYYGERLDHRVPLGYADTRLATLEIRGKPWRPGTLQVRVREPDPAFRTTRSELKLWKDRPDVGMGGLINYAMMLPGGVLLLVSLVLAGLLAARGARWPLVLTGSAVLVVLGWLAVG